MADTSVPPGTKPAGPATIQRHANAVFAPMAMRAGMQLELFTPLADGPMSAEEVSRALGIGPPDRVELLLYALVAAELLTVADGAFANTDEAAQYLVKGGPGYIGNSHYLYTDLWGAALMTAETLRAGAPQAEHDYADMSEEELAEFYRGTHLGAMTAGRMLARLVDLSSYRRLLDVGGGSGGVSIGVCQELPEMQATVAELPAVVAVTRRFIDEAGMAGRVDTTPVNVIAEAPPGTYDAAVLRNLIQVLSADQARSTLANIGKAVRSGGGIHILGWVTDDSRVAPHEAAVHNLVFINIYRHGMAHSEGDHRAWLEAAGFVDVRRMTMPGGLGLVTARKA